MALREAPRERDGRGPEITPRAKRSHPSPLTPSVESKISSVPFLFIIYLNLECRRFAYRVREVLVHVLVMTDESCLLTLVLIDT